MAMPVVSAVGRIGFARAGTVELALFEAGWNGLRVPGLSPAMPIKHDRAAGTSEEGGS